MSDPKDKRIAELERQLADIRRICGLTNCSPPENIGKCDKRGRYLFGDYTVCLKHRNMLLRSEAIDALQSGDALAEIRGEVAREIAGMLTRMAEEKDAETDFERSARNNLTAAANRIRARFGVKA